MIRAGIYNRCSTEEEAQMNALAIQACESREIVTEKGWKVVAQYIESQSGTTSYKRSEYQRLLDDMETDLFDVVVIKSIDRLTRSAKDWYLFMDKMTRCGKRLYIYIDNKFYTPDDSLLTGIKAILAEDFSRELSKKIKNAHKRRQEKRSGLNITVPIFGWDKIDKDTYVLNREEAEAYKLAFALAEEGKGFYSIEKIMYEKGVRSKRGVRIAGAQWRKMLYSPRAHGTVILRQAEYDFEAKRTVSLPEGEWIYVENALPPIVSKKYQMHVLDLLAARVKESANDASGRLSNNGLYAFSGKIYCSDCGAKYYRATFRSKNRKLIEWKCSTALKDGRKTTDKERGCNNINISEDVMQDMFEEACKNQYEILFGKGEETAAEILPLVRKVLCGQNPGKERKQIKKELEKYQKKRNVLYDKLTDEVISDKEFKILSEELAGKIAELQKKADIINADPVEYINREERMSIIKEALYNGIVDKAKTRELITGLDRMVVHPDKKIEVWFDKVKLLSLLKICGEINEESAVDDNFFNITLQYPDKTRFVKKQKAEI